MAKGAGKMNNLIRMMSYESGPSRNTLGLVQSYLSRRKRDKPRREISLRRRYAYYVLSSAEGRDDAGAEPE